MATTLRLIAGDGGREALTTPLFLVAKSRFNRRQRRTVTGMITHMAQIRPMLTTRLVSMMKS